MKVLEVSTAEEAGFCFGVERAIELAKKAAVDGKGETVYTLGPIIHNPQVVSKLEEMGIKSIDSLDNLEKGTVIIRSHGVSPVVLKEARQKGLHIIDATCPYVKNAQKYARKLVNEGYQTFIYGDRHHPEVQGIFGAAEEQAVIVNDLSELEGIKISGRVGFVAQTTKSPESFRELISAVITSCKELLVYNTICNTTEIRQRAAAELANKVEIMFVIGGYNSANTKRLAEICAETGTPTYHIETAGDINWQWLVGKKKIGLSAGASTPDWLIKEVIEAMSEKDKEILGNAEEEKNQENQVEEQAVVDEETAAPESGSPVEEEAEEPVVEAEEPSEEAEEAEEPAGEAEEAEEVEEPAGEAGEAEEAEEPAEEAEEAEEPAGEAEEPVAEAEELEDTVEADEEADELAEQPPVDYSINEIADLRKGQTVTGTVSQIKDDGVYVDVNYKTDGFIPLRELSHRGVNDPHELVELNQEIDVVILTLEDDEGNMILSKKRADYEKAWEGIMEAYENDEIIEAEVTKEVKGGLVVDVGLRGFIPASHVAIGYVEDLSEYVGQTLRLKVIEVERDKNNVVLSAKKVLEEEREAEKRETMAALEVGQVLEGKVTKLVDFGAFVDLGGVEGLLHISEMSWGRIEHPSEVLSEGQDIEVKILGVNEERERISLGYKQLLPDPWEEFVKKHYEGEVVEGTITKIVDFGAFMEIENGIEGLIHISQLSHRHVKTPDEVVTVGEKLNVKIINIDEKQKRVGLSIKQLEEEPARAKPEPKKVVQEEDTTTGVTIRDLVGDIFNNDDDE